MDRKTLITAVAAVSLLTAGAAHAGQQGKQSGQKQDKSAQERVEKQLGPEGNAMGVPEPGTTSDTEETKKQPDVSKIKSSKSIPQLPYTVEGEILKIDGEKYRVSGESGEVSLIVNQDTNFDCAAAPGGQGKGTDVVKTDRIPAQKQAPQASEDQLEQGQRQDETARGAGFKIGNCDFKQGDRVRAQVDDNGRVTTLKYLAQGSQSNQ